MIDAKLSNGDVVTDSTGRFVEIFNRDVLFQRALICIGAKQGSFIYDRTLGSQIDQISLDDENIIQKSELIINEALAQYEGTYAKVVEFSDTIKLEITIGDEIRTEEVHLNGNV